MGPSYNNSFDNSQMPGGVGSVPAGGIGSGIAGGMAGGAVGMQTPISSGQGDIILTPTASSKSKKRWPLIVVVVVLFLVAVVTGIASIVVGNKGDTSETGRSAAVHQVLNSEGPAIKTMISLIDYIYSGSASLASFAPYSQKDVEATIKMVSEGISAMQGLYSELQNMPKLVGVQNNMDLAENYEGLMGALHNDMGKYWDFANLTIKFLQVTDTTDVQEDFAEYSDVVIAFADEIKAYRVSLAKLNSVVQLDGTCTSADITICAGAMEEVATIRSEANAVNPRALQAYQSTISDFVYSGRGSMMYYFNNLYVGTEVYDVVEVDGAEWSNEE